MAKVRNPPGTDVLAIPPIAVISLPFLEIVLSGTGGPFVAQLPGKLIVFMCESETGPFSFSTAGLVNHGCPWSGSRG